jgi:hypothetical protein
MRLFGNAVVPGTFFLDKNLSNGTWHLFEKKQLTP